jgi:hypothetical protein
LIIVFLLDARISDGVVLQIDMVERESERLERLVTLILLQLALPDGDAVPSHLGELLLLFSVSFLVASDLLLPKVGVGLWHLEELTVLMTMPKATIDEDASAVLPQHEVRMTGEPWVVQAIAEPPAPEIMPHEQFRFGVLRPDGGHISMYLFLSKHWPPAVALSFPT